MGTRKLPAPSPAPLPKPRPTRSCFICSLFALSSNQQQKFLVFDYYNSKKKFFFFNFHLFVFLKKPQKNYYHIIIIIIIILLLFTFSIYFFFDYFVLVSSAKVCPFFFSWLFSSFFSALSLAATPDFEITVWLVNSKKNPKKSTLSWFSFISNTVTNTTHAPTRYQIPGVNIMQIKSTAGG